MNHSSSNFQNTLIIGKESSATITTFETIKKRNAQQKNVCRDIQVGEVTELEINFLNSQWTH